MSKKNRNRKHGQVRPQFVAPAEAKSNALHSLDMGFLEAAVVTPRDYAVCQIVVVGAGGIGAYMVQHVGRIMRVMYGNDKGVHLTVVDPDVVEEKNLGRQLFCEAEVGVPKAEAVARRYGQAWGLNCSSFVGEFDPTLCLGTGLTVIVGCVDNSAARRAIAETLDNNEGQEEPTFWWLDCGNLEDTGRVLLGTTNTTRDLRGAFHDKTKCLRLPGPGMQSPGLLETQPDEVPGVDMSCAELAEANLQSLCINSRIASEAADFLARLLVTKNLKRFSWECNLAAGSAKSHYVTPEAVGHAIGRLPAYLLDHSPQIAEIPEDWDGEPIEGAMVDPEAAEEELIRALMAEGAI